MKRLKMVVMSILLSSTAAAGAQSFEFELLGGGFYGPGDKAVTQFGPGKLRNFVPTGPLTGFIPFTNNGAQLPNIDAEGQQEPGLIDGRLSDGTLLNENLNNGFVINTNDPINGRVSTMVGAIEGGPFDGQELIHPDEKGNLVIEVLSAFDSGTPERIRRVIVRPTTGAVRIPISYKTQMGLTGGIDAAGPYKSGRVVIGKLGDFDQNGMLDGQLLLADQSPPDLFVAEGDPVFFDRPFISNLPITPVQASVLTVNGVVANFGDPLNQTIAAGENDLVLGYLTDITSRIDAALGNLQRALGDEQLSRTARQRIKHAKVHLLNARSTFDSAMRSLQTQEGGAGLASHANQGLATLGDALRILNTI